jgi:hypothetical protein
MVANEGDVEFSCPECGKRVEIQRLTLEFNPWVDITIKCRRGFDEMRLTACPGLKREYIKAVKEARERTARR